MNSNELATAIQQAGKELNSIISDSFGANEVNALQHELMKQKCVALYDLLLQAQPIEASTKAAPKPVEVEVPVIAQAPVNLFSEPAKPIVEAIVDEPTPEPIVETIAEEKTETEIQNEIIDEILEQKEEEAQSEPIPMLKEVINELSLHEKISSSISSKPDFADKLYTNISSLKSAINVNLKIAMVNDLFNESSVEYVKAIDRLNSSENIHEAMRFFSELKHTYNWDSDNTLVKELENLIQKRYNS